MPDGTVNVEDELALFLEGRLVQQDQRLLAALRCIAHDLHLGPNADDLAEKLRISRRTIERLFRSHFGLSFGQVVTSLRLCRARLLLEGTELSVTEVAAAVGYSSRTKMADHFRRQLGVSPSEYREGFRRGQAIRLEN
jgi:transcriptional regulator GlxA family with amidase domain